MSSLFILTWNELRSSMEEKGFLPGSLNLSLPSLSVLEAVRLQLEFLSPKIDYYFLPISAKI
jgi:hypothetical protein